MDYSFEMCSLFGEVWLSDNCEACALVLYPQDKRTTLKAILLDIKLIWNAIGISGIRKVLKRESKIKAKQPKAPVVYLWFIGSTMSFIIIETHGSPEHGIIITDTYGNNLVFDEHSEAEKNQPIARVD